MFLSYVIFLYKKVIIDKTYLMRMHSY